MDIKIVSIKKNDNNIIGRTELDIRIESKTTPSRHDIKELISKQVDKPTQLIALRKVEQIFGENIIKATVFIYNNEETLKQFEPFIKKKDKKKVGEKEDKQTVKEGTTPPQEPVEKKEEKKAVEKDKEENNKKEEEQKTEKE